MSSLVSKTRARVAAAVVAALLVGGCTSPFNDKAPEVSDTPRPELSEPAAPLDPGQPSSTASPAEPASPADAGPGSSQSPDRDAASESGSRLASEASFLLIASHPDAAEDAGIEAPASSDLVRLRISSDGRSARFTIDVRGVLRAQLEPGEVMGIGIDIYRSGGQESDYQLFADGGSDGWRAYLQTPDGFVQYPGSFRMGGTTIEFEVPWRALGGAPPLEASVFLDWSKERVALNATASDRLPDRGRIAVAASPV